ncbi:hypothetical protein TIFTF001_017676 [Ficus carica]|uniref:Uncharacterized protein n=1 Tax=Ficus carica TaxID=3494 RepID=A0AA88ALK5_FICCA|nr:hypothetical protein TIFTF001_017676 [Ficus carica]
MGDPYPTTTLSERESVRSIHIRKKERSSTLSNHIEVADVIIGITTRLQFILENSLMTSISIEIVRSHSDRALEGEVVGVRREKTQVGEIGRENYFGGIECWDIYVP